MREAPEEGRIPLTGGWPAAAAHAAEPRLLIQSAGDMRATDQCRLAGAPRWSGAPESTFVTFAEQLRGAPPAESAFRRGLGTLARPPDICSCDRPGAPHCRLLGRLFRSEASTLLRDPF